MKNLPASAGSFFIGVCINGNRTGVGKGASPFLCWGYSEFTSVLGVETPGGAKRREISR
jgi:hypothetical protein